MSILLDGTGGVTTPGVVNTAGETIATTLNVAGVSYLNSTVLTPVGAEGGNLDFQNIGGASAGLIIDVATEDVGRIFSVRNNSTLSIGQLAGTGGIVTISTAATERMRIDSSGNVGIGASSPAFKLDVGGSDGTNIALRSTGTTAAKIRAYVNGSESAVIGFLNGGGQFFETAGTERMRIDSSGNLLVGTVSQLGSAKQTIFAGNTNATTYTTLGTTGGSNLYVQQQQTTSVTTSAVTILTAGLYGSLCLVHGSDGTNRFQDLIMCGLGTGTVNVITSLAIAGTPASRTYSQSFSTYRVAMGSGTYTVQVSALSMSS